MAKARHQNAEVSPAALGVYPAELACFCACRASFACGRITKLGRRSANLTVEAWQDDRERPIATAVMNVLMAEPAT